MKRVMLFLFIQFILFSGLLTIAAANPLPLPLYENINITIQSEQNGLYATFRGEFLYLRLYAAETFRFPLPPNSTNIRVFQNDIELDWTWSFEKDYPTILPEIPTIPLIEWEPLFSDDEIIFRVEYDHALIERPDGFIFFYASGVNKYEPTNMSGYSTKAHFDIEIPFDHIVKGVWLDEVINLYQLDDNHLTVLLDSFDRDLIISIVEESMGDCNKNGIPDERDIYPPLDFSNRVEYDFDASLFARLYADFDNDQKLDSAGLDGESVLVIINNGVGGFFPPVTYVVGYNPRSIVDGDYNNDGSVDLIVKGDNDISLLLNNGDGSFRVTGNYSFDSYISVFSNQDDYNNDGYIDLVVVQYPDDRPVSSNISILVNNRDGTFSSRNNISVDDALYLVSSMDVDDDNDLDLIALVGDNTGSGYSYSRFFKVLLLMNEGMTLLPETLYEGDEYTDISSVVCADLNGDKKSDLILNINYNWYFTRASQLEIFLHDKVDSFYYFNKLNASVYAFKPGDFDSDGDLDIAVTDYRSLKLYLNNGHGEFTTGAEYGVGVSSLNHAADIDSNGTLDLVFSYNYSKYNNELIHDGILILSNRGDGIFRQRHVKGDDLYPAEFIDLNNDLRLDIVTSNDSILAICLNQTSQPKSLDINKNNIPDECEPCESNAECNDGLFCSGSEICESGVCVAGTIPCLDDDLFCNGDEMCNEQNDTCVSSGNPCSPDEECNEEEDICTNPSVSFICPLKQVYPEDSDDIELLRIFRDNTLSKTNEGKELIKLYYHWSPAIVRAMEADEKFKQDIKEMADEILRMLE